MRTHVIINAVAGGFRRHPGWVEQIREACGHGEVIHVTRTLDELRASARVVCDARADMIALCGGDGSHMAGTSLLVEAYGQQPLPHLCLARGGSAGTVGHNWNRQELNPAEHLRRVLRVSAERGMIPFVRRASLRVDDSGGGRRVGFIFGTGLIATFFGEFYAAGGGGYREASRLIGRVLAGSFVGGKLARKVLSPMPAALTIDGVRHPNAAFTLIASSVVRDLGMHMLVTHRAGEDPMRPHLVASSLGARACGMQFWRILSGRALQGARSVDCLVSRFTVELAPGKGAYVLDGDLIQADRVDVCAGPELKIVAI